MLLNKCMAPGRPLDPVLELVVWGSHGGWGAGPGVRSGGPGPGGPARGCGLVRPVRGARPAPGPVRTARSGPSGGGGIDARPTKKQIKQGETLAP